MTSPDPTGGGPNINPTTGLPAGTAIPPAPDYKTGATTGTAPGTTAPAPGVLTTWGLGDYYNQPVFLGTTGTAVTPGHANDPDVVKAGKPTAHWGTTQAVMEKYRKMFLTDPKSFESLQRLLYDAGAYGQTPLKDVHAGQWTAQTTTALDGALSSYVEASGSSNPDTATPITFEEFLKKQAQSGAGQGFYGPGGASGEVPSGGTGTGTGTTVPQAALTDPAAIRQAAQQAAQSALGMGLSDDQLNQFVSAFQSKQQSSQTDVKSAAVTTPDLTAQATQFAESTNPQAYQSHQQTAYANALLNTLLPSTEQRVNITPVAQA